MNKETIKGILKNKEVTIDCHTHVGISSKFYFQYGYPYALSVEDLFIRMSMLGIDYSVTFPFVDSAFYENSGQNPDIRTTTKYCEFPYEIENRNLLKEVYNIFPEYGQRVLPFLMFDPSRETEKQAIHMRKLAEKHPVFGIKTVSTYIQAFVNDLETKGKPILDFARDKDLPIIFHSSIHPDDPWAPVSDILHFAERNPDIRVCIAHSARFVKSILDKAAHLDNCFVDLSAFIIHCKLAQENATVIASSDTRFKADYTKPLEVMTSLANAYPKTIIWGSDTPFYYWIQKWYMGDGTLVESRLECRYDEEAKLLFQLPQDTRSRIAYRNNINFIFGEEI